MYISFCTWQFWLSSKHINVYFRAIKPMYIFRIYLPINTHTHAMSFEGYLLRFVTGCFFGVIYLPTHYTRCCTYLYTVFGNNRFDLPLSPTLHRLLGVTTCSVVTSVQFNVIRRHYVDNTVYRRNIQVDNRALIRFLKYISSHVIIFSGKMSLKSPCFKEISEQIEHTQESWIFFFKIGPDFFRCNFRSEIVS